jgi:hypothetical protein
MISVSMRRRSLLKSGLIEQHFLKAGVDKTIKTLGFSKVNSLMGLEEITRSAVQAPPLAAAP